MPERISHSCAFTALASGWSWTPCGIAFTAGHQLFEVTAMRFTTQWVRLRRRAAPGRCAAIAVTPPRMRIRCHHALPGEVAGDHAGEEPVPRRALPHGEVTSDLAWPMGGPEGCAPCPLVVTIARQPGPTPMLRVRHRSQCRPTGDGGIFRAGRQVGAPQSPSGPRPAIESGSSDGAHHRSGRCLRARRACGRRISAASWPRGTSRCSP